MPDALNLLKPISYHAKLRDFLKQHEAEMWHWFASTESQAGYANELRLELLKTTYRLNPDDHAHVYEVAEQAKKALGLDIPLTIYQAQRHDSGLNASLYYLPGEGHLVFSGNVLLLLKEDELLSVLAHELGHYHLWQYDRGEFYVMDRLIRTFTQSPRARPSHHYTAQNVRLYTEIYCDRASWIATQALSPVVRSLIKIQTGMPEANAESYLKQAQEIFQQKPGDTEEESHPESYRRVQALSLWVKDPNKAENQIVPIIEGIENLDELDLLGQKKIYDLTRELINELLQPDWFQTDPVLAHARLFFNNFVVEKITPSQRESYEFEARIQEYLNYVLLDFTVVDSELAEEPIKQAIRVAQSWGIEKSFSKLAVKELKIPVKQWQKYISKDSHGS